MRKNFLDLTPQNHTKTEQHQNYHHRPPKSDPPALGQHVTLHEFNDMHIYIMCVNFVAKFAWITGVENYLLCNFI